MKESTIKEASVSMSKMQVPSLQIAALQKIYKNLDHAPFKFEEFLDKSYEKK